MFTIRSTYKLLFTLLLSNVFCQDIPEQENSPKACIAGTPDSIGLVGAFNEGSIPDSCVEVCKEKDYDLAFITGGRLARCYCGDSVPTQASPPELTICQTPCTDGIQIGCGSDGLYNGLPAFAVYLINGNKIKTEAPKASDPLALLPPAIYVYIGFSGIVGVFVLVVATFAWIARYRVDQKLKTK